MDIKFCNWTATISDHLPEFAVIPIMFANILGNSNIDQRDWFKINHENFILSHSSC